MYICIYNLYKNIFKSIIYIEYIFNFQRIRYSFKHFQTKDIVLNISRQVTIGCEVLNESCAIFATFAQFYTLLKTRKLPVYDWAPFDLTSMYAFLPTLMFQCVTLLLCANSSVAHETLIAGMMIQICAQFEILCHRAHMLPALLMEAEKSSDTKDLITHERIIIRDLIHQHLYIYK